MVSGKISIIIPCFNDGAFLREALDSVTRVRCETLREVVIVNDGSTDPNTIEELRTAAEQGFTVIHQSNRGLGAARNTAVRHSSGEFILALDSDNKITSAYLEHAPKIFGTYPDAGVVYGDAEYFGEKSGPWNVEEFDVTRLVQGNFIDACATFRRATWESVGGYDERMPVMGYEDWDFWLRVANRGWRFKHLPKVAFHYRVRNASMISNTNKHVETLLAYIFAKPENQVLNALREQTLRLNLIERSRDYRVGKRVVTPLRRLSNLVRKT